MKVTERGQVTLPKWLRDKHGIDSSTEVEFIERDGSIVMVKKRSISPLERFRGIARTDQIADRTDEFLALIRDGEPDEVGSR